MIRLRFNLRSKNVCLKNVSSIVQFVFVATFIAACAHDGGTEAVNKTNATWKENSNIIGSHRQMTFEGTRTGEGYFSANGEWIIFQSERDTKNPFYQIYLQNLNTKKTGRVSPGYGKTTCSWIAPDNKKVIFSSTHGDPLARKKQEEEFDFRKSGQTKRYSWDYDENYDIYEANTNGTGLKNITHTLGYDAESSISPDGKWIAFASNRLAYSVNTSAEVKNKLATDPSYFMDIFIMDRNGNNVRQLTNSPGYDGGPFFSPDGQSIVWRRFTPDGHSAEVYTMKIDGTEPTRITNMNAMSWAPFFHPSGDYLIFTSNALGYHNFELFIVDTQGKQSPVRVTFLDGFDGLPVFTPDGKNLTWNRKISAQESQIVIAPWNDFLARESLNLGPKAPRLSDFSDNFSTDDLKRVVNYLASRELNGRETGSAGEDKMTKMTESFFRDLKLKSLPNMNYVQKFSFNKETRLGLNNQLYILGKDQRALNLNSEWIPLAFSQTGQVSSAPIVFAGYGIRAPETANEIGYDSYSELDIKDKWVLVFRYFPENVNAQRKMYLQRYARLEHKAILAKSLGAKGIIFVSGPESNVKSELIPFSKAASTDLGITAISISDDMAQKLFDKVDKKLSRVQKDLDNGVIKVGFDITDARLSSHIEIHIEKGTGKNTIAYIPAINWTTDTIVIGAHGDHLGDHPQNTSLRKNTDNEVIHFGADDNASGVSAVFRAAQQLAQSVRKNELQLNKNIVFAVWSGEELGNLGSTEFVKSLKKTSINPVAYINMDMVGRWQTQIDATKNVKYAPLSIQGVGSSPDWKRVIEAINLDFPTQLQNDPYLPTDALSFYTNRVPVINFFTGSHADYHTPQDTADKLNYEGIQKISESVIKLAKYLATSEKIKFQEVAQKDTPPRRSFRIFLGTLPDYSSDGNITGVKLNGVMSGGPAEKAGIKGGDIIVELSKNKISNLHDYMFSLETIKPNEPTTIIVLRAGSKHELSITPEAKQ
jgi:Tol biopolymer transport system component